VPARRITLYLLSGAVIDATIAHSPDFLLQRKTFLIRSRLIRLLVQFKRCRGGSRYQCQHACYSQCVDRKHILALQMTAWASRDCFRRNASRHVDSRTKIFSRTDRQPNTGRGDLSAVQHKVIEDVQMNAAVTQRSITPVQR